MSARARAAGTSTANSDGARAVQTRAARTGARQRAPLIGIEVFVEQSAFDEPRGGIQRRGDQRGIHIVGITPAPEALLAVAPVSGHAPGLDADEIGGARIVGERRRTSAPPRQDCARARRHALAARAFRRQEFARPRAAALIVEQPARRERRQQEVVVDHAVVVDRRGDPPASLARIAQHREFADVFLVRHFAVRRETIEHRGNGALHRHAARARARAAWPRSACRGRNTCRSARSRRGTCPGSSGMPAHCGRAHRRRARVVSSDFSGVSGTSPVSAWILSRSGAPARRRIAWPTRFRPRASIVRRNPAAPSSRSRAQEMRSPATRGAISTSAGALPCNS